MSEENKRITVETIVQAPLKMVWEYWTKPDHIMQWNAASDDWHTTSATNDLRVDGEFRARMEAKDKSAGFDFVGIYSDIEEFSHLAYTMEDGRFVFVEFEETPEGVKVWETFDLESENSEEMQRAGWQAILDRFKSYTESQMGK